MYPGVPWGAMGRPLRLEFPGAVYHATGRGDARAAVFVDDTDRRRFLDELTDVVQRQAWPCLLPDDGPLPPPR